MTMATTTAATRPSGKMATGGALRWTAPTTSSVERLPLRRCARRRWTCRFHMGSAWARRWGHLWRLGLCRPPSGRWIRLLAVGLCRLPDLRWMRRWRRHFGLCRPFRRRLAIRGRVGLEWPFPVLRRWMLWLVGPKWPLFSRLQWRGREVWECVFRHWAIYSWATYSAGLRRPFLRRRACWRFLQVQNGTIYRMAILMSASLSLMVDLYVQLQVEDTAVTFTLYSASDVHVGPPWLAKGLPPCSVDGPVLRDAQRNIIPLISVTRAPIVLGSDGPRGTGVPADIAFRIGRTVYTPILSLAKFVDGGAVCRVDRNGSHLEFGSHRVPVGRVANTFIVRGRISGSRELADKFLSGAGAHAVEDTPGACLASGALPGQGASSMEAGPSSSAAASLPEAAGAGLGPEAVPVLIWGGGAQPAPREPPAQDAPGSVC